MVFKPTVLLDETWNMIRFCVEAGEFGDGCTGAEMYTPDDPKSPPGSQSGVVAVYTTREAIDEVGLRLIHKVCQTIRYKTAEATLKGLYARKGDGKVSTRTIYWNNGEPSIGSRTSPADVIPTSITDFRWVYCNRPPMLAPQEGGIDDPAMYVGKWLVFEPIASLDHLWKTIRLAVESGEFGRSCTGARCSTAFKLQGISPDSNGVINVFTTRKGISEVGMLLINKVQRDILYMVHRRGTRLGHKHKQPMMWLYWNNGEPSVEQKLHQAA